MNLRLILQYIFPWFAAARYRKLQALLVSSNPDLHLRVDVLRKIGRYDSIQEMDKRLDRTDVKGLEWYGDDYAFSEPVYM